MTSECKVDELLAKWDSPDSPGCAVGVIQDGQLIYKRGYGMANLEHDVPITSQSVFRIASTSKQFTAMCIALLAEQGKLSLDDDIRQVADIYLADQYEVGYPDHRFIELPREALADKVGVYRSATSGMIVELSLHDGKLIADADPFGESVQIAPIAETDFVTVAAPFDAQIRFERSSQGKLWLMHVHVEGERDDTLAMIEVVSPSANQLAEYMGDYHSKELQVIYRLVFEDGKLFIRHRNAPRDPLKPGVDDMFWVDGITLLFTRDAKGRVSGFTVNTGRVRRIRFARTHSD